jgi:small-conductance mechanosensitive channel
MIIAAPASYAQSSSPYANINQDIDQEFNKLAAIRSTLDTTIMDTHELTTQEKHTRSIRGHLKKTLSTLKKQQANLSKILDKPAVSSYIKQQTAINHENTQQNIQAYISSLQLLQQQTSITLDKTSTVIALSDSISSDLTQKRQDVLVRALRKKTPLIYEKQIWATGLTEARKSLLTQATMHKTMLFLISLLALAITFILFQYFWLFIFSKLRTKYPANLLPIALFSGRYFFRFILYALLLWKTPSLYSVESPLLENLTQTLMFLSLSCGLLHCLIISYAPKPATLTLSSRLQFYFVMSIFSLIIFINNINLWGFQSLYNDTETLDIHTIINFISSIALLLSAMFILPKSFHSQLFSKKILNKEKTYLSLRTALIIITGLSVLGQFFGFGNSAIYRLTTFFQLTALLTISLYLHRVIIHTYPLAPLLLRRIFLKNSSKAHFISDLQRYWASLISGIFLFFASVPIALLALGMPKENLVYFYHYLLITGLPIGGGMTFRISNLLSAIAIFLAVFYSSRILQLVLEKRILSYTHLDFGTKQAIKTTIGYIGLTLALALSIASFGFDMKTITFILSGLSVGIGIGMQGLFLNFFSGFILLIERPIKEGDYIELDGRYGKVNKINLRSTEVQYTDKQVVIVPNSDFVLSKLINGSRGPVGRLRVYANVPYTADAKHIESLLMEAARSVEEVSDAKMSVRCRGDNKYGVRYELRVNVKWEYYSWLSSEIYQAVLTRLQKDGLIANSRRCNVTMEMDAESAPVTIAKA